MNDLDLEVIGPDGTHYYGNQGIYATGSPCLRGGKYDACNNAESVFIPNAKSGNYQILVNGVQVAQGGKQPYAPAASGPAFKQGSDSGPAIPTVPANLTKKVYLPMVVK